MIVSVTFIIVVEYSMYYTIYKYFYPLATHEHNLRFLWILQATGPVCKENKIQNMVGRSLVHGSTLGTYIHTPSGGGELAAGEVGSAGDDKRHQATIGTPNDWLAASAWPEGSVDG
jgi:hypothetical protein